MTETFFKLWFGFMAVAVIAWVAFLIWGGLQLIDILRGAVQ